MSFVDTFQQAAVTARAVAGDLFQSVEYQPAPEQIDYQPEVGRPVWHAIPASVTGVPLLLATYTRRERLDTTIQDNDARGLVAALDLPDITPKPGDLVKDALARVWEVTHVEVDPAVALWDLQLRPFALGWPTAWP